MAKAPLMFLYVPGSSFAGGTLYIIGNISIVSHILNPACKTFIFASKICGFLPNLLFRKFSIGSNGLENSQETTPKAKKFLHLNLSACPISISLKDSSVNVVIFIL